MVKPYSKSSFINKKERTTDTQNNMNESQKSQKCWVEVDRLNSTHSLFPLYEILENTDSSTVTENIIDGCFGAKVGETLTANQDEISRRDWEVLYVNYDGGVTSVYTCHNLSNCTL